MFIRYGDAEAGSLEKDFYETVQLIETILPPNDLESDLAAEGFSIGKLNFLRTGTHN